ncbi:MAG: hypothetical protein ABSG22_01485 [Sedimentisphaerales bacterium]|jgi:hypothetical protein
MTKKNKTILIVALVIGAAITVTMAVSHYSKPDFTKMSPRQIREYFDSNQFRDANEDKRQEMREQMGEAMQARMEAQVNEYFSLPDEKKTAYLDKIIDDMEARRAEFLARDANGPPDPNRFRRFGPRDPNFMQRQGQQARQFRRPEPSRMRERSERIGTDTRIQMAQFRQDLMNRMQERGIQMGPGRGGFGGGFGGPPPGGR